MRMLMLLCASLCALALLLSASPILAQSWVAATGSDANNCFQTSPCATFQRAINIGASQINCVTSGSYGPVTIQTSLIIDCGAGNIGTVSATTGAAITINTPSAATIVLRHLSLNGHNSAIRGIDAQAFSSGMLVIEDCTVQGFSASGIAFEPSAGRGLLQVSDTRSFDNNYGIFVQPTNSQVASVTLNRVELTKNTSSGLGLEGAVVAGTMRDSVAAGNGMNGVLADASQVFFTVEESSMVDNLVNGIETNSAGSAIKVGASTIGGNGTGVHAALGSIVSFGNNQISDNGSDGTFTSTKELK